MDILLKTLQVVIAISLLVFIHELGHFMWAKIFRIRVDKFYIFFDIGGKALFRFRKGETEFGIGWLPLGGYCKIAGMVDESMDLEQLKEEPKPWEFRTHPAWHRLLVMAGGVINNFIFAVLVYICIMGIWGQTVLSCKGNRIYPNDLAREMGFKAGDEIVRFDDYVPGNFAMLQADLARRDVRNATVLRGTDTLDLYIDHAMIGEVLNSPLMFDLAIPFVIDSVLAEGPNGGSELMKGDRVVAFDGQSVEFLQDSREVLAGMRGRQIPATVIRTGDSLDVRVSVDSSGMIGVMMKPPVVTTRHFNAIQAIPAGWNLAMETIGGYLKDLKLVARPSTGAYKSVGSFIAIGQVFPATWDWYQFLQILALLSIILAVMNLIPIPGLDGGHIVILLYEMISGRKPSERFLVISQMIGMAIFIALMMLAFGNDIGRLIH